MPRTHHALILSVLVAIGMAAEPAVPPAPAVPVVEAAPVAEAAPASAPVTTPAAPASAPVTAPAAPASAPVTTPAAPASAPGASDPSVYLSPELAALPVMHRGRIKPLVIAAREIVLGITGKSSFAVPVAAPGGDGLMLKDTHPALGVLADWMAHPDRWRERPLLYTPLKSFQVEAGLAGEWATLAQARQPVVQGLAGGAMQKRQLQERGEVVRIPAHENAALTLLRLVRDAETALAGQALSLINVASTEAQRRWLLEDLGPRLVAAGESAADERPWHARVRRLVAAHERNAKAATPTDARELWFTEDAEALWLTLDDLALRPDPLLAGWPDAQPVRDAAAAWGAALRAGDRGALASASLALAAAVRPLGEQRVALMHLDAAALKLTVDLSEYPTPTKLATELTYRRIDPFLWAGLLYILGGVLTAVALGRKAAAQADPLRPAAGRRTAHLGLALTLLAVALTVYGLAVRFYITRLGAVTNLYETVIFVALIASLLGLVFSRFTGNGLYAVAGGIGAGLCAMVGEWMPPDLGDEISQLQPVLRSKFWLWVHVKTVVASYGAFLLALVLGNVVLAKAVKAGRAVMATEAKACYRALQVGVVLIAAGTILGGVWADDAWGRFWGWDPKEVWALVILLVYLIPLHLRYAGVVGPTGLAAWSVYGFLSVIMSWYGVNFLLGAGKHAYATGDGFGSGGQYIVLPLCGLQIVVTVIQQVLIARATRRPAAAPPSAPAAAG